MRTESRPSVGARRPGGSAAARLPSEREQRVHGATELLADLRQVGVSITASWQPCLPVQRAALFGVCVTLVMIPTEASLLSVCVCVVEFGPFLLEAWAF